MTTFTHSLAILIGIDAYGSGIPPLTTAVIDAEWLEHGQSVALRGRSRRLLHLFVSWSPNVVETPTVRLLR